MNKPIKMTVLTQEDIASLFRWDIATVRTHLYQKNITPIANNADGNPVYFGHDLGALLDIHVRQLAERLTLKVNLQIP